MQYRLIYFRYSRALLPSYCLVNTATTTGNAATTSTWGFANCCLSYRQIRYWGSILMVVGFHCLYEEGCYDCAAVDYRHYLCMLPSNSCTYSHLHWEVAAFVTGGLWRPFRLLTSASASYHLAYFDRYWMRSGLPSNFGCMAAAGLSGLNL